MGIAEWPYGFLAFYTKDERNIFDRNSKLQRSFIGFNLLGAECLESKLPTYQPTHCLCRYSNPLVHIVVDSLVNF